MSRKETGAKGQVSIYLGKCFRMFKNEKGWKCFISSLIIVSIISMVTGPDMFRSAGATEKGSFAIVCACVWIGIFNSIQSICKERAIIKREHRTGSKISSYIMAHGIYEACICAGEAAIITLVVFVRNFSNFPVMGAILPAILELFLDVFLIVLASDYLAMLVSSIVKTEMTAMTVMPFVLILQLVLAGMIFELEGITELLSALTISRWGQAAICVTANLDGMFGWDRNADYEFSPGNLMFLWFMLLTMAVIFLILSIVALSRVDKDKR